mgnify:CR=1 FL=1
MPTSTTNVDQLSINTIRTLSIDAVQKANSGHPGTPMALAPVAYTLWTEWLRYDPAYWEARGTYWPLNILNDTKDLGQHFMNNVTAYKSTVSSVVYKVSEGYKWDESIRGMVSGTTVSEFLANIIKADENQILKVKPFSFHVLVL